MTSVLRGKQWPLVLELMMEMRQRTMVVMGVMVGHVERKTGLVTTFGGIDV